MRDIEVEKNWYKVREILKGIFGKKPDLQSTLFLIGVDELGQGNRPFTKEEKQDLIHIGICKVLSYSGYYDFLGIDEDGWPHYKATLTLPNINLLEQETILKAHVYHHFEKTGVIKTDNYVN